MAATSTIGSYVWITGTEASVPEVGDVRRKIRRQAMQRVATERRSRGDYGKANLGQMPAEQKSSFDTMPKIRIRVSNRSRAVAASKAVQRVNRAEVPRSLPATGFERFKIDHGLDPLDFSALVSFHVGQAAVREMHQRPGQLLEVLRCKQWSYFTYLPQHYGGKPYLDDSLSCVASRLRQYLLGIPGPPQKSVARSYMRALNSLQAALGDASTQREPEVLCACAVLAIYELLEWPRSQGWTRHVAGASALIRLRGPTAFSSEFEKALLLALAGPIYTDAMLKLEPCYFDEPEWRTALSASVVERSTFTDCSEIVIGLWTRVIHVPRLLKDVEDVIRNGWSDTPAVQCIECLRARADSLRLELRAWKDSFDRLTEDLNLKPEDHHSLTVNERPWETLGIYLANLIMLDRAIIALDVSRGPDTEREVEACAEGISDLRSRVEHVNPRAYLFVSFKIVVSEAARRTRPEWAAACVAVARSEGGGLKLIPWTTYKRWVELKGRKDDG